ncbi:MAG: hypothetical protein PF961_03465 [Planctomycetota bacterium]|jgi:O-antigen ligase|nr:hypothetical protein [Planctomycetota bacterium]
MHLITALGLLMLIPSIIALIQEGKDNTVKSLAGITIAVAAFVCLVQFVPVVEHIYDHKTVRLIITITCAVLGIISVVRLKNQVVGTLIVTGGCLLCLLTLGVVQG